MKRVALGIVVGLLLLTGCSDTLAAEPKPEEIDGIQVDLPDGRTVMCVVFKSIQEGGISCDWGGAQ